MDNMVCRYGAPMNTELPEHLLLPEPSPPLPMPEAERRALLLELAKGTICRIHWRKPTAGGWEDGSTVCRIPLEHFDVECKVNATEDAWEPFGIKPKYWASWHEAREPRVWEGETDVCAPTDTGAVLVFPASEINSNTRVRYRIEEVPRAR
jgi:hypothetical protein